MMAKELTGRQRLLYILELDAIRYILTDMLAKERGLSPVAKMIDRATGYDKQKLKDAKKLMKRADRLKLLLNIDEGGKSEL